MLYYFLCCVCRMSGSLFTETCAYVITLPQGIIVRIDDSCPEPRRRFTAHRQASHRVTAKHLAIFLMSRYYSSTVFHCSKEVT
ncbi:uncharacterized protein EV420DRAFT_1579235 [Desarmillaria tabescens]|uniref:Uncharacterized protein n=1 Tax=Armillaria tabescens TaxID=1929756 RepID=A0AA39JGK1_ARMTA|nr:uncharacterized protein EV420DRAFT_1579235 [Desarmillaria tabescens]KAK0442034.1 hypothetical protein EV420DRAFT_1579235 [Desarmillaria tabescens]